MQHDTHVVCLTKIVLYYIDTFNLKELTEYCLPAVDKLYTDLMKLLESAENLKDLNAIPTQSVDTRSATSTTLETSFLAILQTKMILYSMLCICDEMFWSKAHGYIIERSSVVSERVNQLALTYVYAWQTLADINENAYEIATMVN